MAVEHLANVVAALADAELQHDGLPEREIDLARARLRGAVVHEAGPYEVPAAARAVNRGGHEVAVASKIERPARRPRPLDMSGEQQRPSSSPRRPPVTNVIVVGQQLAQAFGAAKALINRMPRDPDAAIRDLRRWYDRQHPDERDRLLWQRFLETRSTHARLEHAIRVAREALDVERAALVEAQAERVTLAARSLPATIEEEAAGTRPEAVRHYQSLGVECQQREAAIAELERLLPPHEQTLGQLPDVTARVLEAVVTIDREAFVRRLRESGELEHLRARFERLRTMANTHAADIDEWRQRVGRPVRVPRIAFPWPSVAVWDALLADVVELPQLVWDEEPKGLST